MNDKRTPNCGFPLIALPAQYDDETHAELVKRIKTALEQTDCTIDPDSAEPPIFIDMTELPANSHYTNPEWLHIVRKEKK